VLGAIAAHGLQVIVFDAPVVVALPALEISEGVQTCICQRDVVLLRSTPKALLANG
jgi:hypothetical protein